MYKQNHSIAIVDDHSLILQGLMSLLSRIPKYEVLATFTRGNDLLTFLEKEPIDIVLLDISLPDINGIDLCLEIKRIAPQVIILGLSNHTERSVILQLMQNGASGYLLKNIDIVELESCLDEAINKQMVFSNAVKEIIANPISSDLPLLPKLTKRETEILKLIASGKTSVQIGEELFLSPLTIETHRKRMMSKFKTKNMMSLIKIASDNKLI
ncbi:response regulator [Sphingobacterium lactis]|uniref:DNA-binding response regulator, NarL/FixJ family, contains REC and HTH domains n=1 Tax=Sphingobacterium lactis TaxID=797291 RepID=A0A1H5VMA4_9SPHI|nr:response regulator transcription factor [Sphingobacterium lactis]SEF88475.1 DNA-binding response regulator, NarL/FixJ family, contains REC and HTH domains [Sphingobacterium lactis]